MPEGKEGYEERWFAFNIDTKAESNLKRTATQDLVRNPPDAPQSRGKITFPDDITVLREKKSDASEWVWLYLLFLVALIVEQALAVHLSFHLKGGEATAGAPAPRAAAA